jgi:anti-sigma regulatory factor (Ser/Thr protein kinase)
VSQFVADSIRGNGTAVTVTTPEHRMAIECTLENLGLDVAAAAAAGSYVSLDAEAALSRFMDRVGPDPARFRRVIGELIERAATGGRPVRAYGEMVSVLWERGDVTAAIELEDLWNDLARDSRFSLLCGYRVASVTQRDDLVATAGVCARHSRIVPPERYSLAEPVRASDNEQSLIFLPVSPSIPLARAFVVAALRRWSYDDLVSDAEIAVSELATNAVRHARTAFRLSIERQGPGVEISVEDMSPSLPVLRRRPVQDAGGRGLTLVDGVSSEWGMRPMAKGKVVWSRLDRTR